MRYGSVLRENFKVRWNLKGIVEDHHVIPKQFKHHPVIRRHNYDMNASSNIVMMPTRYGKQVLNVREDRLVHVGPHPKYNHFVQRMLDSIQNGDELEYLVSFLKQSCRYNPTQIPW